MSAFLRALYRGHKQVAAILMVYGASQDIFEAAAIGNLEQVSAYLDKIPGMLASFSNDGWTPLHLAALFGHPRTLRLLLKRGADPSTLSRNPAHGTPLHAACGAGHAEAVAVLLEGGADPNLPAGGTPPLLLAAGRGHLACAEALLKAGARVNERGPGGRTALGLALEMGHAALAEMLHLHEAIV